MDQSLIFDAGLIKRYDKAEPRYTSYPTDIQFTEAFVGQKLMPRSSSGNQ